jgi:hypothetical protein
MRSVKRYKAFFMDASGNDIIEPKYIYDNDYQSALSRAVDIKNELNNQEITKINIVQLGRYNSPVYNNRKF